MRGAHWRWDLLAAASLAALISLMIFRRSIFPVFIDIYYHISVATMFERAGGVTAVDFLQFAPFGRAHLYPPLYHIILALFMRLGADVPMLSKVASAITYPLVALVTYFVASRLYAGRAGLLALLLFFSSNTSFRNTSYLSPSMIAMALCLMAFYALYENNRLSAAAFMALALYSHISIPHVMIAPLVILSIADRGLGKRAMASVAVAYAFYAPYLWHLTSNISYINTRDLVSFNEVSTVLLALSLIGIAYLLHGYRNGSCDALKLYPVVLTLVMASIYPFYPHRFWFHLYLPVAILGGVGIDRLLLSIESRNPARGRIASVSAFALVLLMLSSYNLVYSYNSYSVGNDPDDPDLASSYLLQEGWMFKRSLFNSLAFDESIPQGDHYIGKDIYAIAENVKVLTDIDDIIQIEPESYGCYLIAMTKRGSTTGMYREIEPYVTSVSSLPMTKAYVLGFVPEEDMEGLTVYPEENAALVIRDTDDVAKTLVPKPVIPMEAAWGLCALAFALAFSIIFKKGTNKNDRP